MNPDDESLFDAISSGVLLCKMINKAIPDSLDERALNKKKSLNIFQVKENLNMAISGAKQIGCHIVNINAQMILDKRAHLILGIVWQIVRIHILREVNLRDVPEIFNLLQGEEEAEDLAKLSAEEILIRWINFHLKNSGSSKRVSNLGSDVKDSEAYTLLLNQLDKDKCDLSALEEDDPVERAGIVVNNAKKLGVKPFIRPSAIANGNSKLNLMFCSLIFNAKHGLPPLSEEEYEKAKMTYDDVEGTFEERVFRLWMNSLDIEDLYISNLYDDLKDGLNFLKVMDHVAPGMQNPKQIEKNPNNRFKQISNCNLIIDQAKKIGIQIHGIAGVDLVDSKKNLVLAVIWQVMRQHYLKVLGDKKEEDIVQWANKLVGKDPIRNFKDKSLKSGRYLIDLCNAIEPRAVDWDIVKEGI